MARDLQAAIATACGTDHPKRRGDITIAWHRRDVYEDRRATQQAAAVATCSEGYEPGDHRRIARRVPRVDFKQEFTALFVDQASRKPTCSAAAMVARVILQEIAQAPFDS